MKTIFGSFSAALAGATAQSIAAAANSGRTAVLNLRFTILYPFIRDSPNEPRTGVDGSNFLDWPEA
jgi:hypothetical protein